ncbi:MAG: hypothetical protein MI919_00365, partial [Holophagales bacterium]|nr:hypothetical protein [Holophagales bacterium]
MKTHRVLSSRPALLGLISTFGFLSSFSEACALGTTTPFFATIKNDSRGSEECLAFGGNGHDQHPQRITWGSGSHCGFDGRRDELLDNRQALWRFTPIGNGEYLIENASQGSYACLLFPANGSGSYPERYRWGPGEACGYAGGISALRQTRLGIWRLEPLGGDQYMMINSSRNPDGECLIFSGNGSYIKPERFDWGPGDYCGFPGGKSALLANRQAVWKIEEVKVDDSPIPAAWENGYLLLQNVLHSNQILQQDPAGMGFFQVDWSEEDKNRFDVQPSGDGNFFFLENARSGRRMHVGHDGDGQLYSSFGGDDDAYKWTAERYQTGPETRYLFRNKLYPDQKLGVQTDGSGFPFAGTDHDPDSAEYRWKVTTVATASEPAHLTYEQYHVGRARQAYDLIFQNKMYPNQRLHAGHDGNGQLYAEDGAYEDFTYRWIARKWGSTELITLSNRNRTYQELFVGFPDGQPEARRMGIP